MHSEFHHGVLGHIILGEAGSYRFTSDIVLQRLMERGVLGSLARVMQLLAQDRESKEAK